MNQVEEMSVEEIEEVLSRVGYGHLGCTLADRPYVVPIHYVFDKSIIYFYTTEGRKTEIIGRNPKVCVQVEEVTDNGDWRSVIAYGEAEKLNVEDEKLRALKLIVAANPTLTPALSIRWMDNWIRENREVVYRITPKLLTGRYSVKVQSKATFADPGFSRRVQPI